MKNYQHIKHIFFDLDHTLWDFDKNSEQAFATIFNTDFPEIDLGSFIKVYAPINQALWKLYQKDLISSEQLRYQRLKQSFAAIDCVVSDDQIEYLAQQYIALLPENNYLFDGTVQVLDYLQSKYKLHIITNGFADVQNKKLHNSGIYKYFTTITNSESAGAKKPNPIIYDHALTIAQASSNESIMIGDCLDADIAGALQFGIDAIWVNYQKTSNNNNIVQINHLAQLLNHF